MLDSPTMAAKIAAAAGIDPTDGAGTLSQTLTVDTAVDNTDYVFTITFDTFVVTFTLDSGPGATTSSIGALIRAAVLGDTDNDGPGGLGDFVTESGGAGATADITSVADSAEDAPLFVAATADVNMTMAAAVFTSTLGDELENTTDGIVGDAVAFALTGDVDDYNPAGLDEAALLILTPDASPRNITGIVPNHRSLFIMNASTADTVQLAHESGSSAAANRFDLVGATSFVIPSRGAVIAVYDSVALRWRLVT